jgi:hypothetical protein
MPSIAPQLARLLHDERMAVGPVATISTLLHRSRMTSPVGSSRPGSGPVADEIGNANETPTAGFRAGIDPSGTRPEAAAQALAVTA